MEIQNIIQTMEMKNNIEAIEMKNNYLEVNSWKLAWKWQRWILMKCKVPAQSNSKYSKYINLHLKISHLLSEKLASLGIMRVH